MSGFENVKVGKPAFWGRLGLGKSAGNRAGRAQIKSEDREKVIALYKRDFAQACDDRDKGMQDLSEVRLRRRIRTMLTS